MPESETVWNSYKAVDVLVKAATPFITALFGLRILGVSKRLESNKTYMDELLEHRLVLMRDLFPLCARVKAFYARPFSAISPDPPDIVHIYSSLRDWQNVAEPFVPKELIEGLDKWMETCFQVRDGHSITIRADIHEVEARFVESSRAWNQEWDCLFTDNIPPPGQLKSVSNDLAGLARNAIAPSKLSTT